MCGISGYIGQKKINPLVIRRTLSIMKNRGQDGNGFYNFCDKKNNFSVNLLHTRLSIIDLDIRSNQPFTVDNLTIIFNGEIYNYLEIKKKILKVKKIKFQTNSDTEVLLQAYRVFGKNFFKYLEGMWSFAIWDSKKKKLLLSRDRFSEKPLYVYQSSTGIYFGSEIKYIKSLSGKNFKIDEGHLTRYLFNGYKSLYKYKTTFFKEINNFPNASYTEINKTLKLKYKKYWTLAYKPKKISIKEAIRKSKKIILKKFKQKFRSDVPVAFCLSGGVDSNTIVSIAKKKFNLDVNTFSIIDNKGDYDESKNINKTVKNLKTKHTNLYVNVKNSFEDLKKLIKQHDGPILTINYFYHNYLMKKISSMGFKVVFSGTGADEIYTGYYDHSLQYLYEMQNNNKFSKYLNFWTKGINKFIQNERFKDPYLYIKNPSFRDHIFEHSDFFLQGIKKNKQKHIKKFVEEKFCFSLLRNRMLNELFFEGTRAIVQADDANSMLNLLENRSPFLDKELVEFMYTVPTKLLINNGFTKYILRESMRGIVSSDILNEKKKIGFNVNAKSIFNFKSKYLKSKILNKKNKIFSYVNRDFALKIFNDDKQIKKYNKFVFCFINTSIFLEEN
jgi:asparagine synthase (glutamine-hydrolysing)